jgi:hypothetical protein
MKFEFDQTIERSKMLHQLINLNVSYWEKNQQDFSTNPKYYCLPPYSPKKFND